MWKNLFLPKSTYSCETVPLVKASSLAFALLISVVIAIVCWQQLGRSLWIDEAMLFSNYPLSTLNGLFSPLVYYDQAATPAYSLLASLLSNFDIRTIRIASLIFISLTCSAILLIGISGWKGAPVALLTITAFSAPLMMLSELKHYGLEIVGVTIAIIWYMKKDSDSHLDIKDLLILISGMLLGISTIINSTVALGIFVITKSFHNKKLEIRDAQFIITFIFIAIGYYFLVKHIASYQIINYSDAYTNKGVLGNIRSLLSSILSSVSNLGAIAVAISLLLLLVNFRDHYAKRLVMLSLAIGFAFIFISAIGLYPVASSRHVTWSAAFFWIIVFYGVYLGFSGNKISKIISSGLLILLIFLSSKNIYSLWHTNHEGTENNQALSLIRSIPPSNIGLWIGAQPVIHYYSRLYPDLDKHRFFGKINPLSARVNIPKEISKINYIEYERLKNQPGGWGSMVMFRIFEDYTLPAKAFIQEAPRSKEFYIFASHYNINADKGYPKSRVVALHQALKNAQCDYDVFENFKGVTIYKAQCPELK